MIRGRKRPVGTWWVKWAKKKNFGLSDNNLKGPKREIFVGGIFAQI
jgi:hypothetical protein